MAYDPLDPDTEVEDLPGEATAVSGPPGAEIPGTSTVPDAPAPPPSSPARPFPAQPSGPSPHKAVPAAPASPYAKDGAAPLADPFTPATSQPPAAPAGVVSAKKNQAFAKRGFTGTIMGTMVFLAKSKRIPLGVKIGAPLLLLVGAVAGVMVWMNVRARDEATARLDAALALPAAEAVSRLRGLDASDLEPESRARLIGFLGAQRDTASVPRFMNALDDSPVVQRAAVDALAAVGAPAGTPAADALAGLLSAEDAELARAAAWALVRVEDGRGIGPTLAALAAGTPPTHDSYAPRDLASAMGREGLLEALGHESATVRQLAAYHLGDYCRPEDSPAIAAVAGDADTATADTALVTLARCDTVAAEPLIERALEGGDARWNGLYTRMQQDAGAAGLGLLLPHAPDDPARRWIIHEMATSLDRRAAFPLVAELARVEDPQPQVRLDVALALATAGDARLVEVLAPLLEGEDDDGALLAIARLGDSSDPAVVEETLVELARRAPEARRRAAIEAMGDAGVCGEDAQRHLARLLAQRDYRAAALRALGRCGADRASEVAEREVAEPLESPITRQDGDFRLAALETVADNGRADVADALFEQVVDPATDPTIRGAIADALAALAPEAMRDRATDRMTDPQLPRAIRAALRRVLTAGVASASVPRLLGFVRGGADDDRTRDAAVVLGLAHHADSRDELVELLGDERAARHAALALMLGGDAETAPALAARVERDEALRRALTQDLDPAPWTFDRGRSVLPHLASAVPLRDASFVQPYSALCEALEDPPEGLRSPTPLQIHRALLETLTTSESASARRLAAEGLACSGARAAVLNVRDSRGAGAAEARDALSHVR